MPTKASKLLASMRQSAANWSYDDILSLYLGYGFEIRNGSKHAVIKHPDYLQLRTTLPRHVSVAKVYVTQAVELVDRLEELRKGKP